MAESVAVKPALIRWAIDRSGVPDDDLREAFPKLDAWRHGEKQPTFKQLELFAKRTMTPLGYLFLDEPPVEELPIPDFRTMRDARVDRPSPNLIETIQAMQRRQAWMRDYVVEQGQEELSFIGSAKQTQNVVSLAARIRETLGLNVDWAESHSKWDDALRTLRNSAERIGILVATSGIVALNTRRSLDPQEFRGFVLCDPYAPLIFVNGADSKSAQMFTLAHELAHLWVGQDAIFNLIMTLPSDNEVERFCNQVAAEFLVPAHKLSEQWESAKKTEFPFRSLANRFKVSSLVAAQRALDLNLISRERFFRFYQQDQEAWQKLKEQEKHKRVGGPDFYTVQDVRLGRRFGYAVVRAAREGRLLHREAFELTDLKGETFNKYADRVIRRAKDERW